jgi:hypothetical protein
MCSTNAFRAVVLAALFGCAQGEAPAPAPAQLGERLAAGPTLWFDTYASFATLGVRYGDDVQHVQLLLAGGSMDLALDDGDLVIATLDLPIAEIVTMPVRAAFPGAPRVELTDVRLELAEPVAAAASWGGIEPGETPDVEMAAELAVDLHWSLVAENGHVVPLGTQRLAPIPARLFVTFGVDGHLVADLLAVHPGVFWSWAGLIDFTELRVELDAVDYFLGPIE